jgi:hypothetical protein
MLRTVNHSFRRMAMGIQDRTMASTRIPTQAVLYCNVIQELAQPWKLRRFEYEPFLRYCFTQLRYRTFEFVSGMIYELKRLFHDAGLIVLYLIPGFCCLSSVGVPKK